MSTVEPTAPDVQAMVDHLFRARAGQMVATLTRILGFEHIDLAEDVVQEALLTALRRWPHHGVPDNPAAWLVQVARNRALDQLRRRTTWRGKEENVRQNLTALAEADDTDGPDRAAFHHELRDDQLRMTFACCHPALALDSQVALTLKTVGGFGTREIARAFICPPTTIAQRLVRAKRKLRTLGVRLEIPAPDDLPTRLDAVLEVIYLMFNEGYSTTEGEALVRHDLCASAIRLVELLADAPATDFPRVHALAALLLFQGARLAARLGGDGMPARIHEQDRGQWDRSLITRGVRRLRGASRGTSLTRYHLEAEIAAGHCLAPSAEATNWQLILDCYDRLLRLHPSPVVALNRAVAVAEVHGPTEALAAIETLVAERTLADYPLLWSTRAELLARLGRHEQAANDLARAQALGASQPMQRFLEKRVAEVTASRAHPARPGDSES